MPHRVYTPEEKANILARLQLNGYDIIATAHQLDVPERTLREWNGGIQACLLPRTPPWRQNPGIIPALVDVLMQRYSFKDDPAELINYDVDDEGFEVNYGRLWG